MVTFLKRMRFLEEYKMIILYFAKFFQNGLHGKKNCSN